MEINKKKVNNIYELIHMHSYARKEWFLLLYVIREITWKIPTPHLRT